MKIGDKLLKKFIFQHFVCVNFDNFCSERPKMTWLAIAEQ